MKDGHTKPIGSTGDDAVMLYIKAGSQYHIKD
jgi:hypothetical protein